MFNLINKLTYHSHLEQNTGVHNFYFGSDKYGVRYHLGYRQISTYPLDHDVLIFFKSVGGGNTQV